MQLPTYTQIAFIDASYEQKLRQLIPEDKIPKVNIRACQKRKDEFYTGRWCAAICIHKKTNRFDVPQINQDRSPKWPTNLIGSISHSNKIAIAATEYSHNALAIGIDIQAPIAEQELLAIQDLILSPIELKRFPDLIHHQLFDLFFSAKETLFKALYPSCLEFFEHKDAEIISTNKTNSTLDIKLLRNLKTIWKKDQIFTINYGMMSNEVVTWLLIEK